MRQKRSSSLENQAIFDFEGQESFQKRAIYYGEAEILPDVFCECYVLEHGEAVMSERCLSSLLGINQMALNRMKTDWPPREGFFLFFDKNT